MALDVLCDVASNSPMCSGGDGDGGGGGGGGDNAIPPNLSSPTQRRITEILVRRCDSLETALVEAKKQNDILFQAFEKLHKNFSLHTAFIDNVVERIKQ